MPALVVTSDFRYVMLGIVSIFFTNLFLGAMVGKARKKYKVDYPTLYDTRNTKEAQEFNCHQRGHQNMLETIAEALVLSLLAGLFFPLIAFGAQLVYCVGRIVYYFGYAKSPKGRFYGEALYLPMFLVWMGCIYFGAQQLAA
jgi:glutathione S-transferase